MLLGKHRGGTREVVVWSGQACGRRRRREDRPGGVGSASRPARGGSRLASQGRLLAPQRGWSEWAWREIRAMLVGPVRCVDQVVAWDLLWCRAARERQPVSCSFEN